MVYLASPSRGRYVLSSAGTDSESRSHIATEESAPPERRLCSCQSPSPHAMNMDVLSTLEFVDRNAVSTG